MFLSKTIGTITGKDAIVRFRYILPQRGRVYDTLRENEGFSRGIGIARIKTLMAAFQVIMTLAGDAAAVKTDDLTRLVSHGEDQAVSKRGTIRFIGLLTQKTDLKGAGF